MPQCVAIAESCIKAADETWIHFQSLHNKNYDELRLLNYIKKQLTNSKIKRYITRKTHCYLTCYLNEKMFVAAHSFEKNSHVNNRAILLNSVLKQRRLFINQLCDEIKVLLTHDNHLTQIQISSLVGKVIDKPAYDYLQHTFFTLTNNHIVFVEHIMSKVKAQLISQRQTCLPDAQSLAAVTFLESAFNHVLREQR